MKKLQTVLLAALAVAVSANAHAEGKHVFILSGQSNMARFNEKVSFTPAVEKTFGKQNVIIVKDAQGGQAIRRWYKGWDAPARGKKKQPIGDLYDRLMGKVKKATDGERIATVTVLWMQGEQDAREPTGTLYRASLEGLFRQFATDLRRKDVSFVIGRLSDFGIGDSAWPHWEAIRKWQVQVADASPRIAWVDTDDLNDGVDKKGKPVKNALHYTRDGYATFGTRLAEAAVSLIRKTNRSTRDAATHSESPAHSCGPDETEESGAPAFPSVDQLPLDNKLPDPFRFFGVDRRVETREDWQKRRAEMLRMVQHYSAGPAFPQAHNAKATKVESKTVYSGKATHYSVSLAAGPGHAIKCTFEYVVPTKTGPTPLIYYICPRSEYAEESIPWREKIIDRGYAFAWVIPGQFNGYKDDGPVKDAFPDVKGNTMMAWVWGINEVIHYLDTTHEINHVIVTGTSRFGKTAAMAGAINERIGLTVPVTGGFGVRRFNAKDQKQPVKAFAGRCWSNDVFPTFAGQLNRMPMDQHFVGALIAPRGLLAIMGDENVHKNVGHIEAYEALVPVYEWLGVKDSLGLYDHAPSGHGIIEDDFSTIMDFADRLFFGKSPASGKKFDQFSNPEIVGFEWKAPGPPAN